MSIHVMLRFLKWLFLHDRKQAATSERPIRECSGEQWAEIKDEAALQYNCHRGGGAATRCY